MEDKNSDDEVKESPSSPQMGGKKLKLNDGTPQETQECVQPPAAATTSKDSKDENFDSGISVDVSESTSSDDKVASTSNNVVHMALPREGITAFFELSRLNRKNYRKRKTPDRDSDSNASSRDSDDLSPEEMVQERVNEVSNSETESEDIESHINRFVDSCSSESEVNTSGTNNSSESAASYESDILRMHSGDTDSDDEPPWVHSTDENDDHDEDNPTDKSPTPVLKPQPKHNFTILREIINREMGLTFPAGKTVKEDVMFERRFYGSLHAVYRLKKLHSLNKHRGCVNAINFHPEGHLLVSGSDDTNVVVWNWAKNIPLQTIKTGHKSNVFQSKFLYLNAESQLNIVTCARDGQVRLVQCGPAGGAASRRKLATHSRAAHKLHVSPHEPHAVLSAGEDGLVLHHDLRTDHTNRLFLVKDRGSTIPLYSIHAHPLEPQELIVAGRDKFIRMYDRRRAAKPVALYCPGSFMNKNGPSSLATRLSLTHLTCAVYNHDGTEILGSYNDENIYLFDPLQDAYDKDKPVTKAEESYIHRYTGHRNSATFKGVAFFGPKSEYIVSGSDCSHIYIWDKKTEAIVQWMQGDVQGVVNCVEAHPRFPILATSGLDKDVKIWLPKANEDPTFEGLERTVRNNNKAGFQSPLFNDFLPTLYDALHEQMVSEGRGAGLPSAPRGNIDFNDGNGCAAF